MNFREFSNANRLRCVTGFKEPLDGTGGYDAAHWVAAMTEELGEIAAAVAGVTGRKKSKAHLTAKDVGKEVADLICYADLLLGLLGIDTGTALKEKFNEISDRIGSSIKIPELCPCGRHCYSGECELNRFAIE